MINKIFYFACNLFRCIEAVTVDLRALSRKPVRVRNDCRSCCGLKISEETAHNSWKRPHAPGRHTWKRPHLDAIRWNSSLGASLLYIPPIQDHSDDRNSSLQKDDISNTVFLKI